MRFARCAACGALDRMGDRQKFCQQCRRDPLLAPRKKMRRDDAVEVLRGEGLFISGNFTEVIH